MAVDILREKIRKKKNPSVIDLSVVPSRLPPHLLAEEGSTSAAVIRFCGELLQALRDTVPAVRLGFASYAMLGTEGLDVLSCVLRMAGEAGYYVLLDAPELYSPAAAAAAAEGIFGGDSPYPCDGLVLPVYAGSDIIKPFLPYCKDGKDIFCVVRTANKSGAEIQDLLSGTRLVHAAAADMVNRFGGDTTGKSGYSRVAIMAAASSAESLRNLRAKYPRLFMLLDGYDYPNSNAKNCAYAFDKFGHGAVACAAASVTCAWQEADSDGRDYTVHAVAAAERMKKNLTRYVTIL